MLLLLFLTLLIPIESNQGGHKWRKGDEDQLVRVVNNALDLYMNTISLKDKYGRQILEGAFTVAAEQNGSESREQALIEFFKGTGDYNVTRAFYWTGYNLVDIPGIVEGYIYSNSLATVMNKTLASIFDSRFREATYLEQENMLACIVINCTEDQVETLRIELKNLASDFIGGVHETVRDYIREFKADDEDAKALFSEGLAIALNKLMPRYEKVIEVGRLYDQYTDSEFKQTSASRIATIWQNHFGGVPAVLGEDRASEVYRKLSDLSFDKKFRQMDMDERLQAVKKVVAGEDKNEEKIL